MRSYAKAMSRYATFRGRASRGEFWGFFLVYLILGVIIVAIDETLFGLEGEGSGILSGVFALAHALPGLAVQVRRLHDINRSGWWVLINLTGIGIFIMLVVAMLRGTDGPNHYGADPVALDSDAPLRHHRQDGPREPAFGTADATLHGRVASPSAAPQGPRDVIGELERLSQLRASGGLTEAEYEVMKAQTLSGAGSS